MLLSFIFYLLPQNLGKYLMHFKLNVTNLYGIRFIGNRIGNHVNGILGRLVHSLLACKAFAPAIALLQLLPNGYSLAARILFQIRNVDKWSELLIRVRCDSGGPLFFGHIIFSVYMGYLLFRTPCLYHH